MNTFFTNNRLVLLFLTLTAFLVYFPILTNDFISDDWHYLEQYNNEGFSCLWHNCNDQFFIPILHLIELLYFNLFGTYAFPYHFLQVLLHVLVSFLGFKLYLHFDNKEKSALIFSLLFLIYPYHAETVIWISAKSYIIALLFGLISTLFYFRWHQSIWFKLGSISAMLISMLCKEILYLLPFVLMAIDYYQNQLSWKRSCIMVALLISIVTARFLVLSGIGGYGHVHLPFQLESIRNLGAYTYKFIFPHRYIFGENKWVIWYSASAVLILLFVLWLYSVKNKYLSIRGSILAVLIFILTLIPVLNLEMTSLYYQTSDRYSYAPALVFLLIGTLWLSKFNRPLRFSGIVISVFLILSIKNTYDWKSASEYKSNYTKLLSKIVNPNKRYLLVSCPDLYRGITIFRNGLGEEFMLKYGLLNELNIQFISGENIEHGAGGLALTNQRMPYKFITSTGTKFNYIEPYHPIDGYFSGDTLILRDHTFSDFDEVYYFNGRTFNQLHPIYQ